MATDNITRVRDSGRYFVTDACKLLGVSEATLHKWLRGKKKGVGVSREELILAAEEHGITLPESFVKPCTRKEKIQKRSLFGVGDDVFSIKYGFGRVVHINYDDQDVLRVKVLHPISGQNTKIPAYYTLEGLARPGDSHRSLFFPGENIPIPRQAPASETEISELCADNDDLSFEAFEAANTATEVSETVAPHRQDTPQKRSGGHMYPGDKILIKVCPGACWEFDIFGRYDAAGNIVCVSRNVVTKSYCIPYTGNEDKLGAFI